MDYGTLLQAWGVDFVGLDDSANIEGSPERTAARVVVRDANQNRWILERIADDNRARKQLIAEQLRAFYEAGLPQIHPYELTGERSFFAEQWVLRPFVEGVPLDRKTYLNDSWRLDALAEFLIRMRGLDALEGAPYFSIVEYAEGRCVTWSTRYPKLMKRLGRPLRKLQRDFFPLHHRLPCAFCHGDYHPLNVVWGVDSIQSVIDWEFCGVKLELYDVALLLGCIGFENPDYLIQEPARRLIERLRAAKFGAAESWEHLLDLMATIRFCWISEWIRRGDEEALEMELVYLDILVDQQEYIRQHWL